MRLTRLKMGRMAKHFTSLAKASCRATPYTRILSQPADKNLQKVQNIALTRRK